jgi:hypothetical protein
MAARATNQYCSFTRSRCILTQRRTTFIRRSLPPAKSCNTDHIAHILTSLARAGPIHRVDLHPQELKRSSTCRSNRTGRGYTERSARILSKVVHVLHHLVCRNPWNRCSSLILVVKYYGNMKPLTLYKGRSHCGAPGYLLLIASQSFP